jgi:hypothetical protein
VSIRCQSWVYEHSEATGNERLILLAIADEADDDGTNAHPGVHRIARKARVNQRTTMRCIERLETAGRLIVVRPVAAGRGHFNSYVVVMVEGGIGQEDRPGPGPSAPGGGGTGASKGDTLALNEIAPDDRLKGDRKARKGAQPYLDRYRPIDPLVPTTSTPRRSPFPAEFEVTPEMRTWATANAPGVDLAWETEQLADWARGKGETKVDWIATWRKWMRTAQGRTTSAAPRPGEPKMVLPAHAGADDPPPGQTFDEWMAEHDPNWSATA